VSRLLRALGSALGLVGSVACSSGAGDSRPAGADAAPPAIRFHHIHARVADPAAAMERYTRANGCEGAILPGLGVGVRCGDTHVLFDRRDTLPAAPVARASVSVTGRGPDARVAVRVVAPDPSACATWIDASLGRNSSSNVAFVSNADGRNFDDEMTHVAFGVRDPASVLARLVSSGARVVARGSDAGVVVAPCGLVVEIVRDQGAGPDAFWCPMHPDVRSPIEGTCPLCRMTLVPIPPPTFGDYHLTVDAAPAGPNRFGFTLRIDDPARDSRVTSFHSIHERLLHLFVVSRRLDHFAHVHPQAQVDGRFTLDVTLPRPDAYLLVADFHPAGGTPQLLSQWWVTPDYRGRPFPEPDALTPEAGVATIGAVRVALAPRALQPGRAEPLTFSFTDARTGAPVTDLEPYLGSPTHLLVASADLTHVAHRHPSDITSSGPAVTFDATFPRAGRYKLFAEFQRGGRVHAVSFVVDVREP
jgi:catechol 2,3-dioxygenase-like lactoylglutathione lyase family enzyme